MLKQNYLYMLLFFILGIASTLFILLWYFKLDKKVPIVENHNSYYKSGQIVFYKNHETTINPNYFSTLDKVDGLLKAKVKSSFFGNWGCKKNALEKCYSVNHVLEPYAIDNHNIYFQGKVISGANLNSFTPLSQYHSYDKNHIYFGTKPIVRSDMFIHHLLELWGDGRSTVHLKDGFYSIVGKVVDQYDEAFFKENKNSTYQSRYKIEEVFYDGEEGKILFFKFDIIGMKEDDLVQVLNANHITRN